MSNDITGGNFISINIATGSDPEELSGQELSEQHQHEDKQWVKMLYIFLFYKVEEGTSSPFLPSALYFMVILHGSSKYLSLTPLFFPPILWISMEIF